MSRRFCPLRAVLLSTFMAVHHIVHRPTTCRRALHRFLPRSLLPAHPVSISCFAMDQNEPVVSDDDDESWATASEGGTTTSEDSEADLLTKIEDARKDLASCPPDHPDRPDCAAWLGYYLYTSYSQFGDISMIDEAIEAEREVLALRPPGHPNRGNSCGNLADSLHARYKQNGDVALLDEAMELDREALSLRPPGHPDRASSCASLTILLHTRYDQTSNVALLDEAIELEREALSLRPAGHPYRATSCADLGASLHRRYEQTGDVALLDEAIKLTREALSLHPSCHPNRANSCACLAASLHVRYKQTGNVALLDEAIELEREALSLRPPGHPNRANSCDNLAVSLQRRYEQTGDVTLLDEAIELKREALSLRPPGHPNRAHSCDNLAVSLDLRYEQTGDVALLDEAIDLKRQALSLRTPGHPNQAISCANLAVSLHTRYKQTGDVALLDEEIELGREVLALQPPGHPNRAQSYVSLAISLHTRYELTGDVALLNEAIETCIYATKHSAASQIWYSLIQLSRLYLLNSPHYSVSQALEYLQQSFQHEVDNTHHFMSDACFIAALIWDDAGVWSPHSTALFVDVYANIVGQLPLVAGFVLDTSSRLKTLKSTARQVGSDACVAASLAAQPATAVSLLDRAHGFVWTQALHQRDPQMEGAPKDLSIELEGLLRATALPRPADLATPADHPQDLRHRHNTRIQAILREIRAMPGLARFMLGSTYETLREAARDHPVVMLVAARNHTFALIVPNASHTNPDMLRLNVANDALQSFANSVGRANMRYRAWSPSCEDVPLADSVALGPDRKMGPGNFLTHLSPLAKLWLDVVKPVLMHLGLTVSPPGKRKSTDH
jgi:tetratricopeptide (TPR) repeat protein